MKDRNNPQVNPSLKSSAQATDKEPLSLTVLVIIADSRLSARVVEASRDQTFDASPESLAALPGQLHRLVQSAEGEAMRGLNQLVAELVHTEPTSAMDQAPKPALEPTLRLVASANGIQMVMVTEHEDAPVADEYLVPLNLPLADGLLAGSNGAQADPG